MFVSRKFYEALVRAETEARMLEGQNKTLKAHLENAHLRLNQLERERAQMLYAVAGVKVAAPEFVQEPTRTPEMSLTDLPPLEDMGDDAAEAMGVSWDKDGRVTYKPITRMTDNTRLSE